MGSIITSISQIWKLRHAEEGMPQWVSSRQNGLIEDVREAIAWEDEWDLNRWSRKRGETEGCSGRGKKVQDIKNQAKTKGTVVLKMEEGQC